MCAAPKGVVFDRFSVWSEKRIDFDYFGVRWGMFFYSGLALGVLF